MNYLKVVIHKTTTFNTQKIAKVYLSQGVFRYKMRGSGGRKTYCKNGDISMQ